MKNFTLPRPEINLDELLKVLGVDPAASSGGSPLKIYFHSKDIEMDPAVKPRDDKENPSKKPEFIFVARKGQKFDAHTLAEKILNSGNIFVGEADSIKNIYQEKAESILKNSLFIPVKNCEQALNSILERAFKINPKNFFTMAVTGTNGKTSVTQITANLLHELTKETILKIGTLGVQAGDVTLPVSHVTTPDYPSFLNILAAAQEHHINKIILEYTSHGLKEKRLGNWLVDIAIFTNLTQDHLDYHKTMDDYRSSKQKLFNTYLSANGTAIINTNNDEWINFVEAAKGKERNLILVGEGMDPAASPVGSPRDDKTALSAFNSVTYLSINNRLSNLNGISGTLHLSSRGCEFSCPLIGEFQFENILCAAAVGLVLNFSLKEICHALKNIKNIPGRLEYIKKKNDSQPTVLVDYAHTPDALEKSILTCKKTLPPGGKLITVFGCGGDRDPTKRPLMGAIAFKNSDLVVVTSDNPRTEDPHKIIDEILQETKTNENLIKEADRKKAIEKAIALASKNDLILVAGKGHEDYQIIGTTKYPFSDANVINSILHGI